MNSLRLFVDVDTQHDFCHPEGALFVAKAPQIMTAVRDLIEFGVRQNDVLLVGSVDTHNFAAWEFAANGGPFPPHCVKGTPGWLKMPGTLVERSVFIPNVPHTSTADRSLPTDNADAVYFEKEVYSLFANPQAEATVQALLHAHGHTPEAVEAVVFGVATDYCVKEAALGFQTRGYRVSVVKDAIAAVDDSSGLDAEREMEAAGCRFLTVEQALRA